MALDRLPSIPEVTVKLFLLGLLLSFSALATESSTFNIEKGKFHKGGVLIATPEQVGSTDQILIKMTSLSSAGGNHGGL